MRKLGWGLLRRRRLVFGLTLAPVVLLSAGWLAGRQVDAAGRLYFDRGKAVVDGLDALAGALGKGDLARAGDSFAAGYRGRPLGLLARRLVQQVDGVRVLAFTPRAGELDRAGALAEWREYLGSFSSLEEVGLHLDRVEHWEDPADYVATLRLELIGTLPGVGGGAAQAAIDRATLRAHFAFPGPRLLAAELVSGERVAAERPLFSDVAPAAGVGFTNRVYPAFLDRPLRFPMIRYGPAGITAADVDDDGWYDLFVPDGVASRLFRNRGDGTFEDTTEASGLTGLDGVSVALFADYDNDGKKDLFVSRTFRHNQLFHNEGKGSSGAVVFRDVTARSGIGEDCCTTVASWADYDADGRLDLYVGRYLDPRTTLPTTLYSRNGEPNRLYHNEGGGVFHDVTDEAGVGDPGLCLGTAFGDYDDDGWPDLWVANDFGRKTLYRNRGASGGGRPGFSDVTVAAGALAYGAGMSANFGDYDNDGRLDLYVTHIRSEHAWFASRATVGRYMLNSWRQGVWKSDMPLYLEIARQSGFDFVALFRQMAAGNNLLRNRGDGTFTDVTEATATNPPGWFWGAVFADLDNDGWLDIYAADGWVYNDRGTEIELTFLDGVANRQQDYKKGVFFDPKTFGRSSWHGWERNRLLRNQGPGGAAGASFREIGRAAGADLLRNSRGVAWADFWNRGRLDLAVAASTDRHALLRNDDDNGHGWLEVELVGTKSNRDAVGARLTARVGALRMTREVALGDGYGSQSALRQHFGLGAAQNVDELTVRWPRAGADGRQLVQTFRDVAGGRIVEVTEGRDALVEKRYPPPLDRETLEELRALAARASPGRAGTGPAPTPEQPRSEARRGSLPAPQTRAPTPK